MAASAQRRGGGQTLDLEKYIDKRLRIKFAGGREVVGVLKGFDQLVNIVLDDTVEYLRGERTRFWQERGAAAASATTSPPHVQTQRTTRARRARPEGSA